VGQNEAVSRAKLKRAIGAEMSRLRFFRTTVIAIACLALAGSPQSACAIDASNVLVLYNLNSPDGIAIKDHYQQVYGLAENQLLGLNLSTNATISAADYLTNIRGPVLAARLPETSLYLTTKGMPLKIQVGAANPGSYVHGTTNQIVWNWATTSSLESELTKIDYISTEVMMGDQSFNQPDFLGNHFTKNLYYQSTQPFNPSNFTGANSMHLAARLDGFSSADVIEAINQAQTAFIGPANNPIVGFMVDADPAKYAPTMYNLANTVAPASGLPLAYDNTTAFLPTAPHEVLGYAGHGANSSGTPPFQTGVGSYIASSLDIDLADGAVFTSWESFNAESFYFLGNHGSQGLLGEWLAKGGTAAVGNVAEPQGTPATIINEDLLIQRLLDGMTFAEAAWSAARQLSWVNTVVGDPLMTWRQLLPGDANRDGLVDANDLRVLGKSWGKSVPGGMDGWIRGDLNGDDLVDFNDLALIDGSWGQISSWAQGQANLNAPLGSPLAMSLYAQMYPNPEPSTMVLLSFGALSLAAFAWRRKSRRP
jgi:uncharacterized protein (TIGR03790 family)